MNIILNGSNEEVSDDTHLSDIVLKLSNSSTGIAIAVDNEVVPQSLWLSTTLHAGAQVEILAAVQGG
ncbi:MAG TPA: sulfur carrier protein ThiS [Candidatus Nanopelagicaceae bacterium]|nr:sulfur carrier protein ThiS [Candidatus Nanopelagicaceae bacterium]